MTKAIVLYMPVIHQGYVALIERHQPADVVLLTAEGCKIIDPVIADQLSRDMRAIPAIEVGAYLHCKFPALRIRIFDELEYLYQFDGVVMPDEDISYEIKRKLPRRTKVIIDVQFLRHNWNSTNIPKEVIPDSRISTDQLDREFMDIAKLQATQSPDFWRQVGAIVPLDNRKCLTAFNKHLPTAMEPYVNGDIRLIMEPGQDPEICGAIHAERSIFAQAVRHGIPLEGRDIYVTTFPCLQCAQMMVEVGFRKVFFMEGYSNQRAAELLRAAGIEIIQVK